jgi:hypothetical protein
MWRFNVLLHQDRMLWGIVGAFEGNGRGSWLSISQISRLLFGVWLQLNAYRLTLRLIGKLNILIITLVVALEVWLCFFQIFKPAVNCLEFANDSRVVIFGLVVITSFYELGHILEQHPTLSFVTIGEILSVSIEEYLELDFLLQWPLRWTFKLRYFCIKATPYQERSAWLNTYLLVGDLGCLFKE